MRRQTQSKRGTYMPKRRNDDMQNTPAKRRQDLFIRMSDRVPFFGGSEFSANGHTVILLLFAFGFAMFGFWHDSKADAYNTMLISAQDLTNCILTLDEKERKEFRLEGKYCNRTEWRGLSFIRAKAESIKQR